MRILIFSDTHGITDSCISVINSFGKADMLLHAGDCVRDAEDLSYIYPRLPLYYVRGNNDFCTNAPNELLVNAEGKRLFLTHGHAQRVKYESDCRTLAAQAKANGADVAVFGHTHNPYTDYVGSVILFNPGSMRYGGTYGVINIENGEIKTKICEI